MSDENSAFVKIATLSDLPQAQVLESILVERAIPHRIRSYHDTAYNGLFQFQKGWGDVYAPEDRKQEIQEIINGLT